jgi:hypothetical protein
MRPRAVSRALLLLLAPATLLSQNQTSSLDFSGVLFGNFQYRTDAAARATTGGEPSSKFDIGRAYLNFRMPAGDKGSIRITTDVYQQTGAAAAYYAGWAIRLKYGYFNYELTKNLAGVEGLAAATRIGMLQTVIIEHVETFWPRWMGNSPVETHGFFSSADVGLSGLFTLPNRWGEVYTTLVNGNGYTSIETDRFKDYAGRFSLTPFGRDSGFLRTLTITPWYSIGKSASGFVAGGAGQVGPVSDGLQKDRRGIFVGLRDRRLTGGFDFAQRLETVEGGFNTVVSPRTVRDRTGRLLSSFAFLRPFEWFDSSRRSRVSLWGRYDEFDQDDLSTNMAMNQLWWGGVMWDLNQRTILSLDFQEIKAKGGSTTTPINSLFLHWVVTF